MTRPKRAPRRMGAHERKALLEELAAMVLEGKLSYGEALRVLRADVLRVDRATFAKAVGLSEAAIAKLEDNRDANPTLKTLAQVFRPFGGRIGLVFPGLLDERPREETAAQRDEILAALERTRRRRSADGKRAASRGRGASGADEA